MADKSALPSPNEGIDDVEPELDLDTLVADRHPSGNPLVDAARSMRAGANDDAEDDDDVADDESDGDEETRAQARDDEDDAGSEDDDDIEDADEDAQAALKALADDDTDESADDTDGDEGEESEVFTLDIPPSSERNGGGRTPLAIEGLTQEHRDRLQYHFNRSAALKDVEQELDGAQQWQAIAQFAEDQPIAFMHMLSDPQYSPLGQSAAKEIGEKFVKNWLQRHPTEALSLLDQFSQAEEETLRDRAELAQSKSRDVVKTGFESQTAKVAKDRFSTEAARLMKKLGRDLEMSAAEYEDFTLDASTRLEREYIKRVRAGQPAPNRTDILRLLQPVVRRYTSKGADPQGRTPPSKARIRETVEDKAKRFEARRKTAKKTQKVFGGASSTETVTNVARAVRKRAAASDNPLKAASQILRTGKLR